MFYIFFPKFGIIPIILCIIIIINSLSSPLAGFTEPKYINIKNRGLTPGRAQRVNKIFFILYITIRMD